MGRDLGRFMSRGRIVVGLVGLPGAGKSTVASLLVRRGAQLVDADRLGHALLEKGTQEYARLVERFGERILSEDGAIDRSRLGRQVFEDPESLKALNRIVHPRMVEEIRRLIDRHRRRASNSEPVLVVDAALLVEWGMADEVDVLVGVVAPKELRARRLQRLRGWTADELQKREGAQWSEERKTTTTMWVIDNSGTMADLDDQVTQLWRNLLRQTKA